MTLVTALLMQATLTPPPIDFDLRNLPPPAACAAGDNEEIVVCGRIHRDQHRLRALPDAVHADTPPKAESILFGDVVGSAVMEAEEVANGVISNRIMLRMKVPF